MNPALVALAVGVVAGGVVAVSARDGRTSIVGLAVALVFSPLIAQPLPGGLPLAARVVASILVVYLLWIVAREGLDLRRSTIGWPVLALVAAAAGISGASSVALTTPAVTEAVSVGTPEARAAAFALAAVAIVPILDARDAVRLGTGLILAVLATALLQQGIGGPLAPAGHLAFAAVMIAVATTSAALGSFSLAVAERAERPVRAGAHQLPRRPTELRGERTPASSVGGSRVPGPVALRLLPAARLGWAQAHSLVETARRMGPQLRERIRVRPAVSAPVATAARAGLAGAKERSRSFADTIGGLRRGARVETSVGEATARVEPFTPPEPAAPMRHADPLESVEGPATHASITARSAGARRSLPRSE